ncbi:MAG: N-6 DNA methylase [Planctomycetota bacterium]|nr:N-6 DNA methylase [Planctomycetota bacterium]
MPADPKPLFRPDVLRGRLKPFSLPPHVADCKSMLRRWDELLSTRTAGRLNEQQLLPDFLTEVFGLLLGYSGPVAGGDRYTLSREQHVVVDGKFADAVLGEFTPEGKSFAVVIEGKGPRDPLERPFGGRKMSAVDQAYRYAINLPCDWIVVTSMRETRLYFKGADQQTYERFETAKLASDVATLKRFVFLLGAERIVPVGGRCHLYELRDASEKVGREITKEFYQHYANTRQDLFELLCASNPAVPRRAILSCAQKLLDRVLFVAFCEDRGLLPEDSIAKAYAFRNPYQPLPVWENFRGLFRAINEGHASLDIPAYNGGLFAPDPVLESLVVGDNACDHFRDLTTYDYRSAADAADEDAGTGRGTLIDVDVLGHIFEQSISDLEVLQNELDGLIETVSVEKHKTRRKKEGAFYTPAFITRYIVDLATLKKSQRDALVKFWEGWQDELTTVRLVDPACGSGAFLIEAFDQLHMNYQQSNDRLEELRGSRTLFDLDRQILQNNLFGVDLNDEAVEICRLSLWIKTAARGKVLTSLDHNIQTGNSVVDDPAVHPRALDWNQTFPEVFAAGGFDVVVGNPPYIRQEWLTPYKAHWQKQFQSYHGVADIFTYFFEAGIKLLRDGGRLGFITSGSWVRGNFGAPLRRFLSSTVAIESMIDFGEYQPFEDAEMIRPTIPIIQKRLPGGPMRIFKWLTSGPVPRQLSELISAAPTMRTDGIGAGAWELDPDNVIQLRQKLAGIGIPLRDYATGGICYGVKTGLNEVFVIGPQKRDELIAADSKSAQIIHPFVQGTHLRPWYAERSEEYLIFTRRGINIDDYPAIQDYLGQFRDRLEPKPLDWPKNKKWPGRKPGAYEWFELQDSVDYWRAFEEPKIVWPDISKLPRFSMDLEGRYLGNTGYAIPGLDYYLLGVLSSWTTWFYISKTAQPLRLRADRWQYRLIAQFMEHLPIPDASEPDRAAIGNLAETCSAVGRQRYEVQLQVSKRLWQCFGQRDSGESLGELNRNAQAWWRWSLPQLGDALKTSFSLPDNPFKKPRIVDDWEGYLAEKRAVVETLTRRLANCEAELNDRVFHLFQLTPAEIELLQREVEH